MNHLLTETHNLDSIIQDLQTKLYNDLIVAWETTKLDAYGRVYRNERKGLVVPEVYDSTLKDYKETVYDDQSCFFFIDDLDHPCIDLDHEFTTNVKIVFMLNLKDLKTSTERADADVKKDVVSLLEDNNYHFKINGYMSGIDNVLRGFDVSKLKSIAIDIQPLHVFAIKTSFSYSII